MTPLSTSVVDAKESLSDLVNKVLHHKERVTLTRRGKEVAAIVPIEDLQRILDIQNKDDLQDAMDALDESRRDGTITLQALLDEIGTAP